MIFKLKKDTLFFRFGRGNDIKFEFYYTRQGILMYKSFYYFLSILLFFFSNAFSQTIIKGKVNVNPSANVKSVNSISYGGCSYDYYDSTQIQVRFIPGEIQPGDTALVQLWCVKPSYRITMEEKLHLTGNIKWITTYKQEMAVILIKVLPQLQDQTLVRGMYHLIIYSVAEW